MTGSLETKDLSVLLLLLIFFFFGLLSPGKSWYERMTLCIDSRSAAASLGV